MKSVSIFPTEVTSDILLVLVLRKTDAFQLPVGSLSIVIYQYNQYLVHNMCHLYDQVPSIMLLFDGTH